MRCLWIAVAVPASSNTDSHKIFSGMYYFLRVPLVKYNDAQEMNEFHLHNRDLHFKKPWWEGIIAEDKKLGKILFFT